MIEKYKAKRVVVGILFSIKFVIHIIKTKINKKVLTTITIYYYSLI
jgi:hypothetical protein